MALRQPSADAVLPDAATPDLERLRRLGLDLHDGPLQQLAAVAAGLYLLRLDLADPAEEPWLSDVVGRVDMMRDTLAAALDELRDLAETAAEAPRLACAFSAALRRAALQSRGSCALHLQIDPAVDELPISDGERLALVYIVQSAVTNAVVHSGGSTIRVEARPTEKGVAVKIADDGTGFDVRSALRRAGRDGRLGLLGMQERTDDIGATLSIRSGAGRGTSVVAELGVAGGERGE